MQAQLQVPMAMQLYPASHGHAAVFPVQAEAAAVTVYAVGGSVVLPVTLACTVIVT